MFTHFRRVVFSGVGAAFILGATAAASAWTTRTELLTFSGPVALPGVTLIAGEYAFDVNTTDSGDVVRVRHRASNRLAYQGFTQPIYRTRGESRERSIVFHEARAGAAMPIRAWFPGGQERGYEFVYRAR